MIRRLRLGDLQRLLRHRYGYCLPDDDAGREDLYELLLPISLGANGDWIKMKNCIEVWAPWMDSGEAMQLIDQINRMPMYLRQPSAQTLGKKMNLLNHQREALAIRTIAPIDMTEEQLKERRKAKQRARMNRLRQAAGRKLRADYLANSLTKLKPWKAEGTAAGHGNESVSQVCAQ